jgi:hypothetical protein
MHTILFQTLNPLISDFLCTVVFLLKDMLNLYTHIIHNDRLCGLVVSVEDYKHRGSGFDSRALLRIFLRVLGSGTGSTQPRDRIN